VILARPSVVAVVVVALVAARAAAGEAAHARLSYQVHDGCPPAATFVEQVRARTARVEFAVGSDAPLIEVIVEITGSDDASHGKLTVIGSQSVRTDRELSSATCAELVAALALTTALTLDSSLSAPPSGATVDPPPEPPLPAEAAPPPAGPPAAAEPPAREPLPSETSLGGDMALAAFGDQTVALGGTVSLDHVLALRSAPSWRAGVHFSRGAADAATGVSSTKAELFWIVLRGTGSPIRFRFGAFDLVPSALLEAGTLVAHAWADATIQHAHTRAIPWLALGVNVRLEARLSARWIIELEAAAIAPAIRYDFRFLRAAPLPDARLFETPRVAATGGAGVRWVFP
jgi:hypothetical protein